MNFTEFHCRTKFEYINIQQKANDTEIVFIEIKVVLQISDEISVQLITAMGYKWNCIWH